MKKNSIYKKSFVTKFRDWKHEESKLINESIKIKAGKYKFAIHMHTQGDSIMIQILPDKNLNNDEEYMYGEHFKNYVNKRLKIKDAFHYTDSPAAGIVIRIPKYEWQGIIEKMLK